MRKKKYTLTQLVAKVGEYVLFHLPDGLHTRVVKNMKDVEDNTDGLYLCRLAQKGMQHPRIRTLLMEHAEKKGFVLHDIREGDKWRWGAYKINRDGRLLPAYAHDEAEYDHPNKAIALAWCFSCADNWHDCCF